MTLPTHKLCPSCEATKPAEAFGQRTQANGKPRLTSYCKACKAAYVREHRATPEGKAKKAEQNRRYYASPEGKARVAEITRRYSATPKGREVNRAKVRRYFATPKGKAKHAEHNRRYMARIKARFTAAFDHFEGRRGWTFVVAGILARHSQARGLQAYNDRFEHLSAWYAGDEEEPWGAGGDR